MATEYLKYKFYNKTRKVYSSITLKFYPNLTQYKMKENIVRIIDRNNWNSNDIIIAIPYDLANSTYVYQNSVITVIDDNV